MPRLLVLVLVLALLSCSGDAPPPASGPGSAELSTPAASERAPGASLAGPRLEPPPPPPAAWTPLIGDYASGPDTASLMEDGGALHFQHWRGSRDAVEVRADGTLRIAGVGGPVEVRRGGEGRVSGLAVGGRAYRRLRFGTKEGQVFRIHPLRPVEELRAEALRAKPPQETGDFRPSDLVELTTLDSTIHLDVRYATTNNFMGARFYTAQRAFLQRPAARALVRANHWLETQGYGLLVHDGYRPWYVTKMFWDATPDSLKEFVANPASGSRHNRGCAVDVTLYDRSTGKPVEMTGGYDEFSPRSYADYPGGTMRQRWFRSLLRLAMEAQGFAVYEGEWWHFDYKDWRKYRIGNRTFEELTGR